MNEQSVERFDSACGSVPLHTEVPFTLTTLQPCCAVQALSAEQMLGSCYFAMTTQGTGQSCGGAARLRRLKWACGGYTNILARHSLGMAIHACERGAATERCWFERVGNVQDEAWFLCKGFALGGGHGNKALPR